MRILKLALLLAVLAVAWPAAAVGTKAVTSSSVGSDVTRYVIVWTSDGSGDVSGDLGSLIRRGYIFQLEFIPSGGGTAPTAAYDVQLQDSNNVNLLSDGTTNAGADLSATASKAVQFNPSYYHDGTGALELVVAAAGAEKSGTVVLWLRVIP